MTKIDEIISHKLTKEEIDKCIEKCRQCVDYKVGDWVETCDMLPGIVQKINVELDKVHIFYPHYALRKDCEGQYNGGSCCSIVHCGIHKITPEYAIKLLSIGRKALTKRWEELTGITKGNVEFDWKEEVERLYKEKYNN